MTIVKCPLKMLMTKYKEYINIGFLTKVGYHGFFPSFLERCLW